ncbi:MAG: tetratricopeptide repeat protein [Chloroflexi bacterium]|nr:tetratricopeptide repeat protein [Chloroflexota bacterium]
MVVHNLPHAAAPFVNRVREIAEITQRLTSPDCHLLTLVGPGGIGKTRLAIQVAASCTDLFDDGVYFVPLQPLDSPEFIISAIADNIHFSFSSGVDPQQQLFQYVREKALLLVLDNFEHLLDGAELLAAILSAAPSVKLLVTSREILKLQEEWRYPVYGLHYPETDYAEDPETFSAVQLFMERVRQVGGDLSLADETAAVVRICQLVEGMPLALELAAVWTKALASDEIAAEIQRNLDFLSTSLRNVPQRHQSMQAVFEQTWRRLSDEEQHLFSALSVFRGGFRREAAAAVAKVSMRVLSDLVDKSLLTRAPDGRYQIHELLRQYAQARLETNSDDSVRVHDWHADYYTGFLHEREQDLNGGRQRDAALEIEAELENIRAAWSWAIEHSRIEYIDQAIQPLKLFYTFQSRFVEGIKAFEKVVQMLDSGDPRAEILLAKALCALGWKYWDGSFLEKAHKLAERSWQLYAQHRLLPAPGLTTDPRLLLGGGYVLLIGDSNSAEQILQSAFQDHLRRGDRHNLSWVCMYLAFAADGQGKYEDAKHYIEQGYEYAEATDDAYTKAYCLQTWGEISLAQGDLADAKRHFQNYSIVVKDFGDPFMIASALQYLGRVASSEGSYAEARRCYEQVLALFRDGGHTFAEAATLFYIGDDALAQGHYGEARRYLRESLQIITQLKHRAFEKPILLIPIGELFLQTGRRARGIELLRLIRHHHPINYEYKERVERLLNRYQVAEEAMPQSSTKVDFDAIAESLLDELLVSEDQNLTRHSPYPDHALIEPLSERELEILRLVAEEHSNREIADQLFLSVATVKWYLTHIYGKLGVPNRTLAILRARQLKLLP